MIIVILFCMSFASFLKLLRKQKRQGNERVREGRRERERERQRQRQRQTETEAESNRQSESVRETSIPILILLKRTDLMFRPASDWERFSVKVIVVTVAGRGTSTYTI